MWKKGGVAVPMVDGCDCTLHLHLMLMTHYIVFFLLQLPADRCRKLLIDALCSILTRAKSGDKYSILVLKEPLNPESHSIQHPDDLTELVSITDFNEESEVRSLYTEKFDLLSGTFGVLLFMYSVLLTKVRSFKFTILNIFSI